MLNFLKINRDPNKRRRRVFYVMIGLLLISVGFNIYLLIPHAKQSPRPQVQTGDVPPDSNAFAALNSLAPVSAKDTLRSKVTLFIKGRNYLLTDYLKAKSYLNARHFGLRTQPLNFAAGELTTLSPSDDKVAALSTMLQNETNYLMGDNLYQDDSPQPHRIHYSWGIKDYTVKHRPTDSCHQLIHGLDCSGFIYQLFNHIDQHIHMPIVKAKDEMKKSFLEGVLKPYFGSVGFTVNEIGPLDDTTQVHTGDILYLRNETGEVSHIGIVFRDSKNTMSFFNCSGYPEFDVKDRSWCMRNQSTHYGMSARQLTNAFLRSQSKSHLRIVGFVRISPARS